MDAQIDFGVSAVTALPVALSMAILAGTYCEASFPPFEYLLHIFDYFICLLRLSIHLPQKFHKWNIVIDSIIVD